MGYIVRKIDNAGIKKDVAVFGSSEKAQKVALELIQDPDVESVEIVDWLSDKPLTITKKKRKERP